MKRAILLIFGALVLAFLAGRLAPLVLERTNLESPPPREASATAPGRIATAAATPTPAEPRSDLADRLNLPTTDIRSDLQVVSVILDTYRSNFTREGNPTGTNAEITAALTGRNKFKVAFIPPDHAAINRNGELCDRWGTPFFFHAESAMRMDLRSAGPDRKMWTDDDVVSTH